MRRVLLAWALAWIALLTWTATPMHAQSGAANGSQFGLTVTSGAVVHLTVPQGTTFCTISVQTNAINYDIGTTVTNAAPTTTVTGNGIQANAGAVISLASALLCRNFGAIAQTSNATLNTVYFR